MHRIEQADPDSVGSIRRVLRALDIEATALPTALSNPLDGRASRSAATNLLDNLLPDLDEVRERMKRSCGGAGVA